MAYFTNTLFYVDNTPTDRLWTRMVHIARLCEEMKMTHWLGMSESVAQERIEEASLRLRNQRQKPPPHCVLMFNRMNDDRSFFTSPPFFFLLSSSTPSVAVLQS